MKFCKLGWILVVTSVLLAGCPGSDIDDNTDAGTGLDAGTDAGTGLDAGTSRCAQDADCGSGQQCDKATGQCTALVERSLRCTDSSGCLPSEICHPTAKVCVQTCVSSLDCPDSAKTCEAVSAKFSQKVCKCSTDALCNWDRSSAGLMCSNVDRVCMPKCTTDAECGTGQTCDTSTGLCKVKVVDTTGSPCSGEGQSTCNYGTFCKMGVCSALPAPTCENYQNFTGRGLLGTTGTILYRAQLLSAATDTVTCPTAVPKRLKIVLSAYSSAPFPSKKDELVDFLRVLVDGSVVPGSSFVHSSSDYTVSADRERADITVSLCVASSSTTSSTAFLFRGGNFLCFVANY